MYPLIQSFSCLTIGVFYRFLGHLSDPASLLLNLNLAFSICVCRKYKSRQRCPLVIIISHGGEADSITRQLRTLPIISIIK